MELNCAVIGLALLGKGKASSSPCELLITAMEESQRRSDLIAIDGVLSLPCSQPQISHAHVMMQMVLTCTCACRRLTSEDAGAHGVDQG